MQIDRIAHQDGLQLWRADRPAEAALEALRDDAGARTALTRCITEAPFEGLFWECRGIASSSEDPLEFALINSPHVAALSADPGPFQAALDGVAADDARAFDNLGGHSRLVAPGLGDKLTDGVHLARFLRHGSSAQMHALWRCVADEALRWMQTRTLWLSTSGLGVSWLHVRLDPHPKYYAYAPYRAQAPYRAHPPPEPELSA
ncbi:MAG: hypothetical protein ACI9U2_000012 [Bradymonadia bacterium]